MSKLFVPHDYQVPMMDHMRYNQRCGIWAPMGGGKTVGTETVLDQLDLVEDVYPVLVLATKRVARNVWGPELQKWQHLEHLRASVVLGSAEERKAALRVLAQYFCTHYGMLPWLAEYFGPHWPFKTVVADELTKLKSFRLRQGTTARQGTGEIRLHRRHPFHRPDRHTVTERPEGSVGPDMVSRPGRCARAHLHIVRGALVHAR
jgi:hypothetical protein